MSSSVFYKFKSQREASRVEFDGTGISVFELKRDIIIKSGLGDGTDFDLAIFDEDGKDEYDDDTAIIPRSTSVIARRLPAMKKGAGRAQRYMTGKMPVTAKNQSRKEQAKSTAKSTPAATIQMNSSMSEEERMAVMFQQSSEQWSNQLEDMGKLAKVPVNYHNKKPQHSSENEPPMGYICYRCGEKGHWIKECPTNDDPNWENKPRIKRTTGIPRSFLKTVDKPILSGDGSDDSKPPSGVMVNAEGQFVVAEPDKASWEQFQAKTKSSAAAQKAAALGDKELQEKGLECSIDKRVFIDPMKTPCCEKTYCNECITNALIESDFTCPGCQTEGVLLDDLKPDDETSAKIKEYLEEKTAALKKERSKSPSVVPETAPAGVEMVKTKSKSPSPPAEAIKSPGSAKSQSVKDNSPPTATVNIAAAPSVPKKRPADELLENPKIPKGPKAMQQQEAAQKQAMLAQQQQQQQQMMNGMNGFPNMFNMPQNFYGGNGFNGMPMMNGFMPGMPNMMMNPMMNMYGMGMMNNMGGMPMGNTMNMNGARNGGMGMGMANGRVNGNGNGMNGAGMGMNNGMGRGGNFNTNMNMNANGMAKGNVNGNVNGMPNTNGLANGMPAFANQQKTIFAEPLPNEEDNAYFRKPVNPHRHQGRQRRARPSDYREL